MDSHSQNTFEPSTIEYFKNYLTFLESFVSTFCNGNVPLARHPNMSELIKYDPLHQALKGRDVLIAYNTKLWNKIIKLRSTNAENTWPIQICAMRIAYCTELIRLS